MKIYVFEDQYALNLSPISVTRAVFDIRIGSETFLDRIRNLFPDQAISLIVRKELADLVSETHTNYDVNPKDYEDGLWLSGSVIWTEESIKLLEQQNLTFHSDGRLVAANLSSSDAASWHVKGGPLESNFDAIKSSDIDVNVCNYLWDIVKLVPQTIINESIKLSPIDSNDYTKVNLLNAEKIFINNATVMPGALINADNGPVIIDDGALVYGQTYIEGPVYIGVDSVINPLTKIKNSVIGQKCKIGGEVDSSIIQGHTNKVHDGHLGDSFLGEWINLGAGTSNSNLKNNYSSVKVHINDQLVDSDSLHIGCFVGDHVKTAIGTLINTGSVIGVGSMIASYGFIPKTIPHFSWYVNRKHLPVDIDKFIATTEVVKSRRGENFTSTEKALIKKISNS
ncbi:MAG: putative sugar nucleotidyl transferase [Candidatus Marinimicrobia bacterium]|nr:putative sugar nucleotidyl transferase [Candidatus Neomarinimicrobiota bacterium]